MEVFKSHEHCWFSVEANKNHLEWSIFNNVRNLMTADLWYIIPSGSQISRDGCVEILAVE